MLRPPLESGPAQDSEDDELIAKNKEYRYVPDKMTWDPNCYECKVRYRDPKAKDLVMYLHAWRYKVSHCLGSLVPSLTGEHVQGPDWQFETRLPTWAEPGWLQPPEEMK